MIFTKDDMYEAHRKATHFDSEFKDGQPYYTINYWKRIYSALHPKRTPVGTEARKKCMEVLERSLAYHLEHTINPDQRHEIKKAQTEIAKYHDK